MNRNIASNRSGSLPQPGRRYAASSGRCTARAMTRAGWACLASLLCFAPAAHPTSSAPAPQAPQAAPTTADRPPPIAFHRFDDPLEAFRAEPWRSHPGYRLKAVPWSDDLWLSLGAEVRLRYEQVDQFAFGLTPTDEQDVLYQRILAHLDLRRDNGLRLFVQLGAHEAYDREGGPAPVDEDRPELQQGFVDLPLPGVASSRLRIGRQEIFNGSGRLFGVREGANIRESFDAVRWLIDSGAWKLSAFLAHPVRLEDRSFDNSQDREVDYWGLYIGRSGLAPGLNADLYWLGLNRDVARYSSGAGAERRQALGARVWGRPGPWDHSLDAVFQFGSFDPAIGTPAQDIRAWSLAGEWGYRPAGLAGKPRLSLRGQYTSGDQDPNDAELNAYYPFYPIAPLLTDAQVLFPVNLIDVFPKIEIQPAAQWSVSFGADWLWRAERADGVYRVPAIPVTGTQASDERYVGVQWETLLRWQPTRSWDLQAAYVHFDEGRAVGDAGGQPFDYLRASVAWRF